MIHTRNHHATLESTQAACNVVNGGKSRKRHRCQNTKAKVVGRFDEPHIYRWVLGISPQHDRHPTMLFCQPCLIILRQNSLCHGVQPAGIILSALPVFHSQIMWFVRHLGYTILIWLLAVTCQQSCTVLHNVLVSKTETRNQNPGVNAQLSLAFKKRSITAGKMEISGL